MKQHLLKWLAELALCAATFLVYFFVNVYGGVVLLGVFLAFTLPRLKWWILLATGALVAAFFLMDFGTFLSSHPERRQASLAILVGGVLLLWFFEKADDNAHKWYGQVGLLLFGAACLSFGGYVWLQSSWNGFVALLLFCGIITVVPAWQSLSESISKRRKHE